MCRRFTALHALCALTILTLPSLTSGQTFRSAVASRDVNPLTGEPLFVPAGFSAFPPSAGPWTEDCGCACGGAGGEACICQSADCGASGQCQPICWYAELDAIWLERDRADHFPISFLGSDVPPSLSTDDISHDFEPGVRATLGRFTDACRSVEVSYLGIHEWNDSAQIIDPTRNLDPFLRAGIANTAQFRNAFMHTISASTDLDSVEVNVRRWFGQRSGLNASFLAGFRYINVDDDFDFLSNDSDPALSNDIGLYSIRADNDLVGGQIGGTVEYPLFSRLNVGLKVKGGLFVNFAEQQSRLVNVEPPAAATLDISSQADDEELAGLIETGVMARYFITPNFGVRAGYDVFIISGLALAPDQLDFTATFTQPFINDSGTLVLHGPYVGGWVNW